MSAFFDPTALKVTSAFLLHSLDEQRGDVAEEPCWSRLAGSVAGLGIGHWWRSG